MAGHELAGRVVEVGSEVRGWRPGERVTVPFVCACGACPQCASGNQQVCDRQFQPGSTHWGSFAEFVAIDHAEVNLVRLPDSIDSAAAAVLGCRFGQAFTGHADMNNKRLSDDLDAVGLGDYLTSSDFAVDVAENWQSEYLRFFLFVMATVWLIQRGSRNRSSPPR